MRAYLLYILFATVGISAEAQQKTTATGFINFEGQLPPGFSLLRDYISNPNNIWQMGRPQKTTFVSALNSQRAICTDLLNPYPVNDTSIFQISQFASLGWSLPAYTHFAGWYFVDTDSLNDFGIMELSPNNGLNWIDLVRDTIFNLYSGIGAKRPTLTGHSGGWRQFKMYLHNIADSFNVQMGDIILLRVTFISDGIQTNRDGLMFDNLEFVDRQAGVEEAGEAFASTPSPNPATSTIHFTLSAKEEDAWRISLYTLHGQKVKRETVRKGAAHQLSVSDLPAGSYYYTITGERTRQTSSGSVIIAR